MVKRNADVNAVELWGGISRKTLNYGDKTLMVEIKFSEGSVVERHSHPHEQTGYLISGKIVLTIGDKTWDVFPGDSWIIPSEVPHCAEVPEKSVAVEVFSPVREDYITDH